MRYYLVPHSRLERMKGNYTVSSPYQRELLRGILRKVLLLPLTPCEIEENSCQKFETLFIVKE
jgi:hypothetical protein